MHVRNRLVSPPFVMYYLTFLLPGVQRTLEQAGLEVQIRRLDALTGRWGDLRLVTATRQGPSTQLPPAPGAGRRSSTVQ